jgi:hypothetical protein
MSMPPDRVGHARILVVDRRGEKFEEVARGMIAGAGNCRRRDDGAGDRREGAGGRFGTSWLMRNSVK